MKNQFLTPAELIEKYPAVMEKFHWSPRELGLFLKCKLLEGHYDRKKRCALLKESSFLELVRYTNQVIERQKIDLYSLILVNMPNLEVQICYLELEFEQNEQAFIYIKNEFGEKGVELLGGRLLNNMRLLQAITASLRELQATKVTPL